MQDPEEYIDDLILQGAIEPVAYDADSDEMLYSFTDKLKEIDPGMHKAMAEEFYNIVMYLWEIGILEIDLANANPLVRITQKAFEEDAVAQLSLIQKSVLDQIIQAMKL